MYNIVVEFSFNEEIFIAAAMKRLQDMGASYFILDLRGNRGGLVQVCMINLVFICIL